MKQPDFTPEEERFVAYYKAFPLFSKRARLWHDLSNPLMASVFVGLGMFLERFELVYIGFCILLFSKIGELFRGDKWASMYATVVQKYEAALHPEDTHEA